MSSFAVVSSVHPFGKVLPYCPPPYRPLPYRPPPYRPSLYCPPSQCTVSGKRGGHGWRLAVGHGKGWWEAKRVGNRWIPERSRDGIGGGRRSEGEEERKGQREEVVRNRRYRLNEVGEEKGTVE